VARRHPARAEHTHLRVQHVDTRIIQVPQNVPLHFISGHSHPRISWNPKQHPPFCSSVGIIADQGVGLAWNTRGDRNLRHGREQNSLRLRVGHIIRQHNFKFVPPVLVRLAIIAKRSGRQLAVRHHDQNYVHHYQSRGSPIDFQDLAWRLIIELNSITDLEWPSDANRNSRKAIGDQVPKRKTDERDNDTGGSRETRN